MITRGMTLFLVHVISTNCQIYFNSVIIGIKVRHNDVFASPCEVKLALFYYAVVFEISRSLKWQGTVWTRSYN